MNKVEVIWNGPDDSMIPNTGIGMNGEKISMSEVLAKSYASLGLVKYTALKPKALKKEDK